MATIGQIRERVNQIKPNRYDIARWIGELDARIALDVMLMDISECEQFAYHRKPLAEQETIEPLLKFPHDECYDLWLFAKIDSSDGETELYQNDMNMFNAMFGAYEEWFVSTYDPANNGTGQIRYYITAYSLAVQQGFQGDINAWLASLRGLTGKSAYEYAVEGGYTGSEEAYKTYMATLVETDTSFTKAGAAADAAAVGNWKGQLEQQLGKNFNSITGRIDVLGKTVGTVSETAESAKHLGEQALPKSGGTMAGELSLGGHRLTNLGAPEGAGDGVNKGHLENYVNQKTAAGVRFSPVSENQGSRALGAGEGGMTLKCPWETNVTYTLSKADNDSIPLGAEIAFFRYGRDAGKTIHVTFSGDLGFYLPGESDPYINKGFRVAEFFGLAAMKKVSADRWLVCGPVEVMG